MFVCFFTLEFFLQGGQQCWALWAFLAACRCMSFSDIILYMSLFIGQIKMLACLLCRRENFCLPILQVASVESTRIAENLVETKVKDTPLSSNYVLLFPVTVNYVPPTPTNCLLLEHLHLLSGHEHSRSLAWRPGTPFLPGSETLICSWSDSVSGSRLLCVLWIG